MLANELQVAMASKHFLGTIHGFLHRYVLRPYANLLGAERGPFVVEDGSWPHLRVHGDNRQRITLDQFRFDANGTLVLKEIPRGVSGTAEQIIGSVGEEVRHRKAAIFQRAGLLTADDAMWIALKLLREYVDVATALAGRFDELLLDEAQDTSELQLACLDVLLETGALGSLVLVGDLEQSIFSFQGASASLCAKLAEDRGLDVLKLDENHRSSQLICNVAINFCGREVPDNAVGPDAACEISPEVVLYSATDPGAAMDLYRARLAVHGIEVDDATVLARAWKVVNALNGQTPLFKEADRQNRLGQLAARLAAGTLTRRDVEGAQRLIAYCAWDTTHIGELDDEQQRQLRRSAGDLLEGLPGLDGDVRSWLVSARTVLHEVAAGLKSDVSHTGGRAISTKQEHAQSLAAEVFSPAPPELHAQTVHSFKGEDSDAVMVVIRQYHGSDPTAQVDLWEAVVAGADPEPEKAEEQRVMFVALSRARRYCLVALPNDARGMEVAKSCAQLGFELVAQP